MTWQLFCIVFCPIECGFFATMIAVIAFTVESQGIKLLALAACELTEASAEAVATFKAQILNPLLPRDIPIYNAGSSSGKCS